MAVTQHSVGSRQRCRAWPARGLTGVLATIGAALSVAALPAGALAAASPTIEGLSASHVTQNNATLEAQIKPDGLETTYELLMEDPCSSLMECIRVPQLLTGTIAAGTAGESVSINLQSSGKNLNIEPETTYGYWVVAKNSAGTVESSRVFTTLAANTAPPSIGRESVSNITEHDATLEAQINPNGLETAYEFQIDTNGSYNYTKPNCPFGLCESISVGEPLPAGLVEPQPQYIPAGSGDKAVTLDLASIRATLQSGTTYHYRVIASIGSGPTVEGSDQTFTTLNQLSSPPEQGSEPSSSSGDAGLVAFGLPGASVIAVANPPGPLAVDKVKGKALTTAQKLAKALRLCEKEPNKQRTGCKKQADQKYASADKKSHKHKP
jgi:hypothetical protein